MESRLSRAKKVSFGVVAALIAFALVEAGVRISEALLRAPEPQTREELAIYPDKEMARTLFREDWLVEGKAVLPFSGWGPKEFQGKYIHVDQEHVRQTWNPAASSATSIQIFVFGGSTAWGFGARDEHTIPSYLSKRLNGGQTAGSNYHVRNYGEGGYTLMQGAVRLFALLAAGESPDYVIFYGGANEINDVYLTGVPGVAASAERWKNIFEEHVLSTMWDRILLRLQILIVSYCESCKVAIRAAGYSAIPYSRFYPPDISNWDDTKIADIARRTADDYQNHLIPFLNDLAGAYDFKLVIFWQPTLFTESERVGEENLLGGIEPFVNSEKAGLLFRETYRRLRTDVEQNVFDISDALSGRGKECYSDSFHLSEDCNRIVAERIVQTLREHYLQ